MKREFRILIMLWGTGREVTVWAYSQSQAIALAKMGATSSELEAGQFEVIARDPK